MFHRQETGTQSNILFMQSMLFNELLTLGLFDLGQFEGRERSKAAPLLAKSFLTERSSASSLLYSSALTKLCMIVSPVLKTILSKVASIQF